MSNVSNVSVVVGQVSEDRATANVPLRCFEISSKMQWPKLHTAREHGREIEHLHWLDDERKKARTKARQAMEQRQQQHQRHMEQDRQAIEQHQQYLASASTSQLDPVGSRAWIQRISDELVATFECDQPSAQRAARAAFKVGGGFNEAAHYLFEPEEVAWLEQNGAPVRYQYQCTHCKRGFQTLGGYQRHSDRRRMSATGSCVPSSNKRAAPRTPRSPNSQMQQQGYYARQTNPLQASRVGAAGATATHSDNQDRPATSPPRRRSEGESSGDNPLQAAQRGVGNMMSAIGNAWNAAGGQVVNAATSAVTNLGNLGGNANRPAPRHDDDRWL